MIYSHHVMAFLKDNQRLCRIKCQKSARAQMLTPVEQHWQSVGLLMQAAAEALDIAPETALAVWVVESGNLPFIQGKPVLRLECHKLWENWGQSNSSVFDQHFQFGGRADVGGASWTNHKFRTDAEGVWRAFHGNQDTEYEAFDLACSLASIETACRSASFGGPQILGINHAVVGYDSATSLFNTFADSLEAQVLGFFDFCHSQNIVQHLQSRNWSAFARVYNGPGQANAYAGHINDAYLEAQSHINQLPLHPSIVAARLFDSQDFATFFASLNIKHFSAAEFLFRGSHHAEVNHPGYGFNSFPEKALWPNIAATATALDGFRTDCGRPIVLTSVFRSHAYNRAINGSINSQHLNFAAVDFEVKSDKPVAHWLDRLRALRADGLFAGAVGTHGSAIHLDTRGEIVDF
jgi:hypothetical protein